MGFDMVDDRGQRHAARFVTGRHDWRPPVNSHAAEREPLAEPGRRARPTIRVAAGVARAARQVDRARVRLASARRDERPATWLRAENGHRSIPPNHVRELAPRRPRYFDFVARFGARRKTRNANQGIRGRDVRPMFHAPRAEMTRPGDVVRKHRRIGFENTDDRGPRDFRVPAHGQTFAAAAATIASSSSRVNSTTSPTSS